MHSHLNVMLNCLVQTSHKKQFWQTIHYLNNRKLYIFYPLKWLLIPKTIKITEKEGNKNMSTKPYSMSIIIEE